MEVFKRENLTVLDGVDFHPELLSHLSWGETGKRKGRQTGKLKRERERQTGKLKRERERQTGKLKERKRQPGNLKERE